MKIYYQGFSGAYSHEVSLKIAQKLDISEQNILGLKKFKDVFEAIKISGIGVLPIENSYAGDVHENFYHLISGNYTIIGEIYLDINHYLLSNSKDIKKIKKVYSHPQALAQCNDFIEKNGFEAISYGDTAGSAKFVSESGDTEIASISSKICSTIYDLNILGKNIQDQKGNTTRFFIVVSEEFYKKNKSRLKLQKNGKTSITFKTRDIPAALYKCLGAFATRFINLSKIESLPSHKDRFEYIFWVDFANDKDKKIIDETLEELRFFCKDLHVLGEY